MPCCFCCVRVIHWHQVFFNQQLRHFLSKKLSPPDKCGRLTSSGPRVFQRIRCFFGLDLVRGKTLRYLGLSPLPVTVTTRIICHSYWEGGQPKRYPYQILSTYTAYITMIYWSQYMLLHELTIFLNDFYCFLRTKELVLFKPQLPP